MRMTGSSTKYPIYEERRTTPCTFPNYEEPDPAAVAGLDPGLPANRRNMVTVSNWSLKEPETTSLLFGAYYVDLKFGAVSRILSHRIVNVAVGVNNLYVHLEDNLPNPNISGKFNIIRSPRVDLHVLNVQNMDAEVDLVLHSPQGRHILPAGENYLFKFDGGFIEPVVVVGGEESGVRFSNGERSNP